jgi:hypothetical protein
MNKTKALQLGLFGVLVVGASCVDHRPIRNGLKNESIYIDKADLTAENPKRAGSGDDSWLFKVTVVSASSPNVAGDYAFPGFESDTKLVKFRFREDVLQMLDAKKLQKDDANDPNDDLATSNERVMLEFGGQHVDIKLRESLDGERTNYLEENTEEPWQTRQEFRVDFESASLDPIVNMAWFYGSFLHDCARMVSANLVPDSFEWEEENKDYMAFTLEVNYEVNVLTYFGACYDLVSLATGVGTATIQYHFSFYRPDASDYVPEVIAEKDPVNKKYGSFQVLDIYRDEETGLLSSQSLLHRWDPNRAEPATFYFAKGFPARFKPMFEEIKAETNKILEDAGAALRLDFKEYNDGGVDRKFGDLRYSFVTWHQDIDTTRGLLGYGPSGSDPRTGEIISANLNLYNVGMDYYRFLIQDYLEEFGGRSHAEIADQAGKDPDTTPWEQIGCAAGETVAPMDQTVRLKSELFEEMRRVMELAPSSTVSVATDDFIPTPTRGMEAFLSDYHRTLPEVRYVNPLWNAYVYEPAVTMPLAQMTERLAKEREFKTAMSDIMMNKDPFGGVPIASHAGIEKQNKFLEDFRGWKKNHDLLTADMEYLLDKKSISVFDANDAITAISKAARKCKTSGFWESDEEYQERIIESVVFHVAIHELGHNLSLRHNFYGSVDAKHQRTAEGELSASVMDYIGSWEEAEGVRSWGGYDAAALTWIYGDAEKREAVMGMDYLYCTDEHRSTSALCSAHDLGITPAQIVLNSIERYDWLYSLRNRRAYRTFWDTSGYVYSVYNAIFPIQRMWYLALFDWGGGGVQNILKRSDQVEGTPVATDQEYNERAQDFYNDASAAIELTMAFYDAVINQPASFRNYQTEFDPYYGDILRVGIILDKLFTTFAYMDLQEVYNYNPNVYTYISMYDAPAFGNKNLAVSQRVLDNMLGAGYDTFPWFRYYALLIYSSVTNSNLVDNEELKERIAVERYDNEEELVMAYGEDVLHEALRPDNPAGVFVHGGEEYVYTFLPDRAWHLVASKSRSPVSYQFMREYNQDLRAGASEELDNFGLKVLLAYYEYFNNFSGF